MRIEKRLKKIEKKVIVPEQKKYHTVIVEPDENEDEKIKRFKRENEVCPEDKFWIIRMVSPKKRKKNDQK